MAHPHRRLMKIQNGDIWMSNEPLTKLLKQKFPVKTSYALVQLAHKLTEQLEIINQVRLGLVEKYGEKGEGGQTIVKEDGPNWQKFTEEFDELMSQEVEIEFEKVKLPDFEIEPTALMALEKFVEV